jgi:uncharacterized protein YjbJ (UPF0337 family)
MAHRSSQRPLLSARLSRASLRTKTTFGTHHYAKENEDIAVLYDTFASHSHRSMGACIGQAPTFGCPGNMSEWTQTCVFDSSKVLRAEENRGAKGTIDEASPRDEIKGKFHEVRGKAKEKAGRFANDPDLEAKDQTEMVARKSKAESAKWRTFWKYSFG